MNQISTCIKERRSVRTFDNRVPDTDVLDRLFDFASAITNPYDIPVSFKLLHAGKDGLSCPVVTGTDLYVGGKIKNGTNACVAFGYSFERFVLFAQSLGLGTVWLGGTMNRSAFENAMDLCADEMMPCATPIGYPAKKMSVRETMMRKAIKAEERLPFETLFFRGSFAVPLVKEQSEPISEALELVRLAPSAVNKQPWRAVVTENTVHFYLKRSKGMGHDSKLDMQKIDMGIALCHFALAAENLGLTITFDADNPCLTQEPGMEYIASYIIGS